MVPAFSVGDDVQTPLGKGVVREVRTNGRLLVDIGGRKVLLDGAVVRPLEPPKATRKKRSAASPVVGRTDVVPGPHRSPPEVDLHGLTVDEALARVDSAINDALLEGHVHLRVIHGRSGGRIRTALHRHLRALPPVRAFRLDPKNDGVTVAEF
jgi:dsDNA-specific endonuclease/ATPase MutS2